MATSETWAAVATAVWMILGFDSGSKGPSHQKLEHKVSRAVPTQKSTFGIVGGYGATGRAVIAELLRCSDGELLVGGRDPAKLESSTLVGSVWGSILWNQELN